MSACADGCSEELPAERPTLRGSKAVRASALAWLLIAGALVGSWIGVPAVVRIALYAAAIACGAYYFAREAVEEVIKEREVGIELLMTIAIAAAAALGQWREAALVAALYSISEAMEGFTVLKTRYAIRGLMDLVPPRARVLREGIEIEVDVRELRVGDLVRVRPGESIPVDGVIREGASAVNESAVTGESMPIDRAVGDPAFAGTLNGNGALLIESTKRFEDNTVNAIIQLVEKAQSTKGRSQLWAERFGRVYSPTVLLAAVATALVPVLLGLDAAVWLRRAVAVLVAASPCALAIATPITLIAAIGAAARRGVLIKGGQVVEQLGRVRAVALDKTGTLTLGRPAVTVILGVGKPEAEVLALAASVEHLSEHPLAAAIVRAAEERGQSLRPATDFQAITAAGVVGRVEGQRVAVFKPTAAASQGITLGQDLEGWASAAQARGETAVVVALDDMPVGMIALADTIRPEASALVASLRKAGIQHVIMLTGDNIGTARAIASQVGIEEFYGGLLPADKVERVKALAAKYGGVAMIGDGINDGPALATASVGIAMGTAGSDAALAAADVALMGDDLSKVAYAVTLGRRSTRLIAQNIGISLLIVAALVVGVFAANLTLFIAVVSHEGSELLVILNGLRAAL